MSLPGLLPRIIMRARTLCKFWLAKRAGISDVRHVSLYTRESKCEKHSKLINSFWLALSFSLTLSPFSPVLDKPPYHPVAWSSSANSREEEKKKKKLCDPYTAETLGGDAQRLGLCKLSLGKQIIPVFVSFFSRKAEMQCFIDASRASPRAAGRSLQEP